MTPLLPSVSQLIDSAWKRALPNYWKLMGIALVGMVVLTPFNLYLLYNPDFVAPTFDEGSIGRFFLVLFATLFISIILQLWTRLALNRAVIQPKKAEVFQSYKESLKLLPAFLWIYFLAMLASFPAFVLFIVPGFLVLMSIWFSAWFISTGEARGVEALAKSRELFRGAFWRITGRAVFPFLIVMVISYSVNFGLPLKPIWNEEVTLWIITIFNPLFTVLVSPFIVQYDYELFVALKKRAPKNLPAKEIQTFKVLSIIGGVILALYIAFVILFISLSGLFSSTPDSEIIQRPNHGSPSTVIQP